MLLLLVRQSLNTFRDVRSRNVLLFVTTFSVPKAGSKEVSALWVVCHQPLIINQPLTQRNGSITRTYHFNQKGSVTASIQAIVPADDYTDSASNSFLLTWTQQLTRNVNWFQWGFTQPLTLASTHVPWHLGRIVGERALSVAAEVKPSTLP